MEESSYNRCRKFMIIFNILFLLGGVALMAVGGWVVFNYEQLVGILSIGIHFQSAAYIIIVAGAVVTAVAFVGCIGAWQESKLLLTLFVNSLVSTLLAEISALVLAFWFTSSVEIIIRNAAMTSILAYGKTKPVTMAWDYAHNLFFCCGFNNGTDFVDGPFDLTTNTFQPWPQSCCTKVTGSKIFVNRTSCLESPSINQAYTYAMNGCYAEIQRTVTKYSVAIGAVTAGVLAIQLLDVITACCVMTNIDANKVAPI